MSIYPFVNEATRTFKAGLSRTLIVSGNVYDLFFVKGARDAEGRYVPLMELLTTSWDDAETMLVVYEINGPIHFVKKEDRQSAKEAWTKWRGGISDTKVEVARHFNYKMDKTIEAASTNFENGMQKACQGPAAAFEFLRQLCMCARMKMDGKTLIAKKLLIIVEGADKVLPAGEILRLSDADRQRLMTCFDWFSDPDFINGPDSVILLTESRSQVNTNITGLPHVEEVQVSMPEFEERLAFIRWFRKKELGKPELFGTDEEVAKLSAALSIRALEQMLKGACYDGRKMEKKDIIAKVKKFIEHELGDMVEFSKPEHCSEDVKGARRFKKYFREEVFPRLITTERYALPGICITGSNGAGKDFTIDAYIGETGGIVFEMKNTRSMYYGGTDLNFDRFRRILYVLYNVFVKIGEADTQFGGVGKDVHETERRLTGQYQNLMADPRLRGRVVWVLTTARPQNLSPDIRRPGRVGSCMLAMLEPEPDDREEFITWILQGVFGDGEISADVKKFVDDKTKGYSPAAFQDLLDKFKARKGWKKIDRLSFDDVKAVVRDVLPSDIGLQREYQNLQALLNCTSRGLLPSPDTWEVDRPKWEARIRELESLGIGS